MITSNDGFSVVAPIRTTVPASTAPSNASCCALLNRCISSIKRIGAAAGENKVLDLADSITSRTSLTPALTAERVKNSRSKVCEIIFANVVFPTPGGPHKMNEDKLPVSIILRRMQFSPTRCRWPAYSERFLGRMRSGSGGNIFVTGSNIVVIYPYLQMLNVRPAPLLTFLVKISKLSLILKIVFKNSVGFCPFHLGIAVFFEHIQEDKRVHT